MTDSNAVQTFEIDLPVTVYTRPLNEPAADWTEFDQGPGRFEIPAADEINLRAKNIDDEDLYTLVKAVSGLASLTSLNLSENRKITDLGLSRLAALPGLTRLNLSSCSISNQGLAHLTALKNLEHLDISYCNRITDEGLRFLKSLNRLAFLDIQRCVKTSHAGVKKIERRGLVIHR
ncbi:MAG: leucine-rich repeat domain-containing protein [Bellilinea sp.]